MWQRSTSQRRAWPPFLNTIGAARSSATDSLCLDGSQGSPLSAVLSSLLPRWRAASRTAAALLHYGIAARPIQTLLTASPPDDVTIAPSPDLMSMTVLLSSSPGEVSCGVLPFSPKCHLHRTSCHQLTTVDLHSCSDRNKNSP